MCCIPARDRAFRAAASVFYSTLIFIHFSWCFVFQDPNWYKAKNAAGREGTIPANYVQKREGVKSGGKLSLMPWV